MSEAEIMERIARLRELKRQGRGGKERGRRGEPKCSRRYAPTVYRVAPLRRGGLHGQ